MNRNIKNGLFGWYEKGAMKLIEDNVSRREAGSVKLTYIALCSISAKNNNAVNIQTYQFNIADFASLSDKSVRKALKSLEKLNIIELNEQERASNGKFQKVKISLLRTNGVPSVDSELNLPTEKKASDGKKTEETSLQKASEPTVGRVCRTESLTSNFPIYINKLINNNTIINKKNIYNFLEENFKEEEITPQEKLAFKFYVAFGEEYFKLYGGATQEKRGKIYSEWVSDFEKILRIDKIEFKAMDLLLNWLYRLESFSDESIPLPNSDFWRQQIKSPSKFRKRQKSTNFKYVMVLGQKFKEDYDKLSKSPQNQNFTQNNNSNRVANF